MKIENIISPQLITNGTTSNMFDELDNSLKNCKSFIFSVAFINYSGLQLLLKTLNEANEKGIKGKVITSDYLNFTEPKAIRKLTEFENIETKIYLQQVYGGFHTKAYIFEYEDDYQLYIGSSNITSNALLKNIEWNVKIISKKENPFVIDIFNQFNELWNKTQSLDERFLIEYENFIENLKDFKRNEESFIYREETIRPNSMQLRAMQSLKNLRSRGEDRGLVIAATATGKTYMSAFDVQNYNPQRLLFLVHREDILLKAVESFKKVLGSKIDVGVLSGTRKEFDKKYLFSTINSMNLHFNKFEPNDFDYIILDESHHAVSESYQRVMNYFKPNFILGMTATPERTDGFALFNYFNNNVALEIRLHEAIDNDLVCPFHYFGITEVSGIDFEKIDFNDSEKIGEILSVNNRVEYVLEKLNFYGHDGKKLKALGFCASLKHAEYMADEFNKHGIRSKFLSGSDSVEIRKQYINEIESDSPESIKVLFTVDIFNEGIDIPSINTVLMLRPTSSPIIFIQQLGRGLRKYKDKEYVTVLDFIGNYKKSFLIAIALNGSDYLDKDSLKVTVKNNFKGLPGTSFVQMDEIAREQILKQLEFENFNSMKYLKDEYLLFKKLNNYKIPFYLMEYELLEGSPDPVKFIRKSKTYQNFLSNVEKSSDIPFYEFSLDQINITKQLSRELPLNRPLEFIILLFLLEHEVVNINDISIKINSYIKNVNEPTIIHAINNLLGKYLENYMKSSFIHLVSFDLFTNSVSRTKKWNIILVPHFVSYFTDILKYGITRYSREYRNIDYFCPFFVIGKTYSIKDASKLAEMDKDPGNFFGSGVIPYLDNYFLYAELYKDTNIRQSINYKNRIIDKNTMQWESQNTISQVSKTGLNLIHNTERNIKLHMFVRKFKEVDGVVQPYIYLGLVDTFKFESNKPIRFVFNFREGLPEKLLNELITDTKSN